MSGHVLVCHVPAFPLAGIQRERVEIASKLSIVQEGVSKRNLREFSRTWFATFAAWLNLNLNLAAKVANCLTHHTVRAPIAKRLLVGVGVERPYWQPFKIRILVVCKGVTVLHVACQKSEGPRLKPPI